ncbi:hypothetical protein [Cellulomonas chengniuliangii]|uniref:hypothetical protein n=1 Tax=Cellulomonas chengniuliangii TaxID=2968084 RepID=UPI001D0E6B68|nr:hypothetical protein [Cellulomonas chengniuliangii]MCC2316531.1 hypothetical protein [Cellulomonas chengniuliangii]
MAGGGGDRRVAATLPRTGSRGFVLLAVLLGCLAVAVRLGPVLHRSSLRGVIGYDDGVHLAAAQHLLAGSLPYADFTFLQPGGVVVALAPFAALAGLVGDSWAMAAARVATVLVAALNAVLVAAILRPRGWTAAVVGGVLYATWGTITIAERTAYLEPLLNVCVLVALLALRRPSGQGLAGPAARAVRVAAVMAGLAVSFKLWGAVDVLVLGALVWARAGLRAVGRGALWCVAGLSPALALAAADPAAAWRDIVVVQQARPADPTGVLDRIGTLVAPAALTDPTIGRGLATAGGLLLMALCAAPLVRALAARQAPAAWGDPVWWGLLGLAQLALLLAAPSWGTHYTASVGPALCLLVGAAAGRAARTMPAPGRPWAVAGAAVLAVPIVVSGVVAPGWGRPLDNGPLAAFAREHRCVWSATPSLLAAADAGRRRIRAGCPDVVDVFGVRLALAAGEPTPELARADARAASGAGIPRGLAADERIIAAQLADSQAALLAHQSSANEMSPALEEWLRAEFVQVGRNHYAGLWTRLP